MPWASSLSSPRPACTSASACSRNSRARSSLGIGARDRQPDVIGQGQEPLLRAVVKVALEPALFRVAGLDYPRTRRPELAELEQHLRLEPLVFQAEPDGWAEFPLELGKCRGVATTATCVSCCTSAVTRRPGAAAGSVTGRPCAST